MWYRNICLFCLIFIALLPVCYGQTVTGEPEPTAAPTSGPDETPEPGVTPAPGVNPTPEPYAEDEFPQWTKDLRRAEIIMVGSIPFTMFLAIEIFDIYRFISTNGNSAYAFWPIKGTQQAPYEFEDKVSIVITAVSFSVCIAIIDYIIVRVNRGKKPVIKQRK